MCRCKNKEFIFDEEETTSLIGLHSASFRRELDTVNQQIEYIYSMCLTTSNDGYKILRRAFDELFCVFRKASK